jgi:hypothetical protein
MISTPRFQRMVRHSVITFVGMCAAFITSGAASYGLVSLLGANARLLIEHGSQAIMDGALLQLFQLTTLTVIVVFGYLAFKVREHALVERFAHDNR